MALQLLAMSETDFSEYLAKSVRNYATEKMKGETLTSEEAEKIAETSFATLLPDGISTKDHYLFNVVSTDDQMRIGILWFGLKHGATRSAFVYDIELESGHRGKGYGRETMRLLEEKARSLGCSKVALHVFGHNNVARSLYENTGYRTTNVMMAKEL